MVLDKLPPVITRNKFNKRGLIETDTGVLVPAYMGSGLGFNFLGLFFLNNYFYPKLQKEAGILPLCPFESCGSYLDFSRITEGDMLIKWENFWNNFNRGIVGPMNYQTLMPRSKMMIALLEGHAIDEGLAGEIPEFLHTNEGPLLGIRSDFRLAENLAAPINPANRYFFDYGPYKDRTSFIEGPPTETTYELAIERAKDLANRIRN